MVQIKTALLLQIEGCSLLKKAIFLVLYHVTTMWVLIRFVTSFSVYHFMRTCTLLASDILTFNKYKLQNVFCTFKKIPFLIVMLILIYMPRFKVFFFPNIWNIFVQVLPREDPLHYKKFSDFINKFLIGYFVLDVLINYQISLWRALYMYLEYKSL